MQDKDFLRDCQQVFADNGLEFPANVVADGKLHRCGTSGKPHSKDGAYILHMNGSSHDGAISERPTLWWQNHRTGESGTFTGSSKGTHVASASQTTQLDYPLKSDNVQKSGNAQKSGSPSAHMEAKQQRQEEQDTAYAERAQRAQEIWAKAPVASDDHPYLFRKNVPAYGLKLAEDGRLIVNVQDERGKSQSLQFIDEDGKKRFLTGGKKAGGYFHISAKDDAKTGPLCICEGYATAASVRMATGHACLVAFDAGNLMPVARFMREKCPNRTIILCADNDVKNVMGQDVVSQDVVSQDVANQDVIGQDVVNQSTQSQSTQSPAGPNNVGPNNVGPNNVGPNNVGVSKAMAAALATDGLIAIPPAHEGKATDFNDLHYARSLDAVRELIDNAPYAYEISPEHEMFQFVSVGRNMNKISENKELNVNVSYVSDVSAPDVSAPDVQGPIPLFSEAKKAIPYPLEACGAFAPAVEALAHGIKVPVPMAAASVLSALSCCTQGIANVVMKDGRTIPLSLFVLSVADSGDRKSALDRVVLQKIYDIEKDKYTQYQDDVKYFKDAKEAWESLSNKEREGRVLELEEPRNPTMVMENVNSEGAFRQLKEGNPSVIFSSDEGGTFFGGQGFQKENVLKTITFFSNLWDGKHIDKIRSGEGASRLYDRRGSMHMMLQPHVAQSVLGDVMMQSQGFLPRFLLSYPESIRGSRIYSDENTCNNNHVRYFYSICEKLLNIPLRLDERTNGIIFDSLYLSETAHKLWVMHHDNIESMLSQDGYLSPVSAYASKNAEQAIRIAGILTLAEDAGCRTITGETMANAITLAQWYVREALRLREDGTASPELVRADKLLQWMKKQDYKYFSLRLIRMSGPISLRPKRLAEGALKTLEDYGYLKRGQGRVLIKNISTLTYWELVA